MEDNNRGCRSKSNGNEENIAAFADLVKNVCRIASIMIAESLNISKTVVFRISEEDLGKKKMFTRFVPHFLKPEQRRDRVSSCRDISAMVDTDKNP